MKEVIRIIAKTSIPGHGMLTDNFLWVDGYQRLQEIKDKKKKLKQKLKEIKKTTPSKKDLIEQAKEQYKQYLDERINFLTHNLIFRSRRGSLRELDFIKILKYNSDNIYFIPYISFEEIEQAINKMPLEDGPEIVELQKERGEIEKQLAELQAEIDELSPTYFFHMKNGAVIGDIRDDFFYHWLNTQGMVDGPCNYQGIYLRSCPPEEQVAYEKLGIERALRSKQRKEYTPHPGYK